MIEFGKWIVELPLLITIVIATISGVKTFKVATWGPDDKTDFFVVLKAIAYVIVPSPVLWFGVTTLGVVGTVIGCLLTSLLALTTIPALVELPQFDFMDPMFDLAAKDGWRSPWRRSAGPVPLIRWARRFVFVILMVFLWIMAILSPSAPQATTANGDTTTAVVPQQTTTSPTAPATAAPQETQSTSTPDATDSTVQAQQSVESTCPGPKQITMVDSPSDMTWGKNGIELCYNGQWQGWSKVSNSLPQPTKVSVTAWMVDGKFGYGQATDARTGDAYIFRTANYH